MASQDPTKPEKPRDMTTQDLPAQERHGSTAAAPDVAVGARLEADLQAHIGRQLRAVYNEVVNEPVPDRFIKLLEELERKKADGS
jgi:hypothetical protein